MLTNPTPGSTTAPGPVLSSCNVTFNWNTMPDAVQYSLAVEDVAAGTFPVSKNVNSPGDTETLVPGREYMWAVTADYANLSSAATTPLYFQTPAGVPTSPGTSTDTGSTVPTLTPTLQWTAAGGADYYAPAISHYPYGTSNILTGCNPQQVSGTSWPVPTGSLHYGTKYCWNMETHDSAGWSPVSNTLYFQTAAPTPTNPTPGSTTAPGPVLSSCNVTFNWNTMPDAVQYSLAVEDVAAGTFPVSKNVNSPGDTETLVPGREYMWAVTADYANLSSAATTPLYFQTPAGVPTSPGTSTDTGSTVPTLTPTLQWTAAGGADYYAPAISHYPYGTSNILTGCNPQQVSGTSWPVPTGSLHYGTKYCWNMETHDSAGWSPVSNTLYFQTVRHATNPTPGSTTAPGPVLSSCNVTFNWDAMPDAVQYSLAVEDVAAGTFPVSKNVNSPGDTETLVPGREYMWAVTADYANLSSAATTPLYFQTPAGVPTSPGTSTDTGSTVPTLTPTLQWTAAGGADYYAPAISHYPYGTSNILTGCNPQQVSGTSWPVPTGSLHYGTKYCLEHGNPRQRGLEPRVEHALLSDGGAHADEPNSGLDNRARPCVIELQCHVQLGCHARRSAVQPRRRGCRRGHVPREQERKLPRGYGDAGARQGICVGCVGRLCESFVGCHHPPLYPDASREPAAVDFVHYDTDESAEWERDDQLQPRRRAVGDVRDCRMVHSERRNKLVQCHSRVGRGWDDPSDFQPERDGTHVRLGQRQRHWKRDRHEREVLHFAS